MASNIGSPEYMTVGYVAHQQQYRNKARESDRVILEILEREGFRESGRRVLDIGCHNTNLLYHLRHRFPTLSLAGGDIVAGVIDGCRRDPSLQGIDFETLDVLSLDRPRSADCVIANALLFRFADDGFAKAWRNIFETLDTGGIAVVFDWYHGFRQTLRIVEETPTHPDGLILYMRSIHDVAQMLKDIGFASVERLPFEIGIDLPLNDPSDALHTHTRQMVDGSRLQFRGTLFQPWCHVVARKPPQ